MPDKLATIHVEFHPDVLAAIRKLYALTLWDPPSPDFDEWTFEELSALYFRVERHSDLFVSEATSPAQLLDFIHAQLGDYLADEFA